MSAIRPQRKNANRHTERGMHALERSIEQDGWIGAITVAADGETFDGSARVETTAANGMLDDAIVVETDGRKPIIVKRTDIPTATDPRAVRLGLAANRVAQLNLEWEPGVLADLAQDIDVGALWTPEEWREAAQGDALPEPGAGGDEFDTTPDDGPTRAQSGDLWLIDGGRHRLIVGDCTDPAVVARLMGGERAQAVVTDPPYAVAYVDKARDMHQRGYGHSRAQGSAAIEGDEIDDEQAEAIWRGAFGAALEVAADTHAGWYIWHGDKSARLLYNVCAELGMLHHQIIVWQKNNFVIGRLDYQSKHELCWYGWKQGNRPPFYGEKNQTTVWEVGRDLDPEHPTQKPIALYEPALINHTKPNGILYDCFAGSGPALVAAHRHNRRAFLIELSPSRADVILRRAEAEGLTVERAETPHKAETTP